MPTRSEHNIDDAHDPPEHDLTAAGRVTVHDILEHLYATIGNYDDEHHVDALYDAPADLRVALYRLRDLVAEAVAIVDSGGPG